MNMQKFPTFCSASEIYLHAGQQFWKGKRIVWIEGNEELLLFIYQESFVFISLVVSRALTITGLLFAYSVQAGVRTMSYVIVKLMSTTQVDNNDEVKIEHFTRVDCLTSSLIYNFQTFNQSILNYKIWNSWYYFSFLIFILVPIMTFSSTFIMYQTVWRRKFHKLIANYSLRYDWYGK